MSLTFPNTIPLPDVSHTASQRGFTPLPNHASRTKKPTSFLRPSLRRTLNRERASNRPKSRHAIHTSSHRPARLRKHLAIARHPTSPNKAHKSVQPHPFAFQDRSMHPRKPPRDRTTVLKTRARRPRKRTASSHFKPRTSPGAVSKDVAAVGAQPIKWDHFWQLYASRLRQCRRWVWEHSDYRLQKRHRHREHWHAAFRSESTFPSTSDILSPSSTPFPPPPRGDPLGHLSPSPIESPPSPYLPRPLAKELMAFFGASKHGPERPEHLSPEGKSAHSRLCEDIGDEIQWAREMVRQGRMGKWGGGVVRILEGGEERRWEVERGVADWGGGEESGGEEVVEDEEDGGEEGMGTAGVEHWTVGESDLEDDFDDLISLASGGRNGGGDADAMVM